MAPLLRVADLGVSFAIDEGVVRAVDGVSLELERGEVLAVVGESGCGKSALALTIVGLTRAAGTSVSGSVTFAGLDLLGASERELRRVRGRRIATIFQDPAASLNPVRRVGSLIVEQVRAHEEISRAAARERAVELLASVGVVAAGDVARAYPHELSGGLCQRVAIAIAIACRPSVLIADEPTTALDASTGARVLDLIDGLRRRSGLAVLLVTHDLGAVAAIADRVAVMYAGRIVERGPAAEVLGDPQHPYTWGLLDSSPRPDRPRGTRLAAIPGAPPSLLDPPGGCHFRPRCPHEFERCARTPALAARVMDSPGHEERCWLSAEEKRARRAATVWEAPVGAGDTRS